MGTGGDEEAESNKDRTYAKIAEKLNLSNRQDEAVRWAALPT
ncbi:MAG: hypothetical protein V7K35_22655 [Nostoc sp.]